MKHFIGLIGIIALFIFSIAGNTSVPDITEVVITIPGLNTEELQSKIVKEFLNFGGVTNCETSVIKNELTLTYHGHNLSENKIRRVLKKWDCYPTEFSYKLTEYSYDN